jgi:hypothetical protein
MEADSKLLSNEGRKADTHESNLFRFAVSAEDECSPKVQGAISHMPQKIMDVLMLGRCSHEFAWPRRAPNGEYYQVCLQCATTYQYDWKTMRRGDRVEGGVPETAGVRRRSEPKQPTWVPRARRLKLDVPIRFRVKNLSTWFEGVIQNISQSGVLFHGPQQLPANALLEMVFEMPEEISGQKNSTVLCQGRLIRAKETRVTSKDPNATSEGSVLAASILDYKFLRQERPQST